MRSEMYPSDTASVLSLTAEPKPPSTPPSNPNKHQRTSSRLETPPSLFLLGRSEGLLQARITSSPISPTTLPRRPRKGMVRQMAFSYGSPKNIKAQKSLDFRASLGSSTRTTNKLFPSTPSLDIDKELSILFDDSASSWLPLSNTPSSGENDRYSENKENIMQEDMKDQLWQDGLNESATREHLEPI